MLKRPYSRDPEVLSREVFATLKARDILEYYQLREQVQMKWWEVLVMALLFIAGLGFMVTLLYLLPPKNVELYLRFLKAWIILLVIAGIATLEIILVKVRAMARIMTIQGHMIQDLERIIRTKIDLPPANSIKKRKETPEETEKKHH